MQKQCYYECHITIEAALEKRDFVRSVVEFNKWSYSEHDEDHEIGPGLRCYANCSFKASMPVDRAIAVVKNAQERIARNLGRDGAVVRYKVEFVLFDVVTDKLTTEGEHLKSRRNTRAQREGE